jgi:hypothetical protein
MGICIAGYDFCELSMASSPKYYFRNPDWYIKWFGMVDHQYLAYYLDLRTPLPFPVATPPPTQT